MRGHWFRRDKEATKAAGFLSKRSHITLATHHGPAKTYLFGKDVLAQRERIWRREGKRCFDCWKPLDVEADILAENGMHRAHLVARSKQGDDSDSNLICLCRNCHIRRHGNGASMHF